MSVNCRSRNRLPRPTRHHIEGRTRGRRLADPSSASARFQRAWRNVSTPAGRAGGGLRGGRVARVRAAFIPPFPEGRGSRGQARSGQARGFVRVAPRRDHNSQTPQFGRWWRPPRDLTQGRDRGHRLSPGRPVRGETRHDLPPDARHDQAVRHRRALARAQGAAPSLVREDLVTRDFTWRHLYAWRRHVLRHCDGGVDRTRRGGPPPRAHLRPGGGGGRSYVVHETPSPVTLVPSLLTWSPRGELLAVVQDAPEGCKVLLAAPTVMLRERNLAKNGAERAEAAEALAGGDRRARAHGRRGLHRRGTLRGRLGFRARRVR